jgi:2,4-dienoyl-CoA reductase-like NADH-dependent reductase (Old Yellow Enzyme family)
MRRAHELRLSFGKKFARAIRRRGTPVEYRRNSSSTHLWQNHRSEAREGVLREVRMAFDTLFEPLAFRSLTLKNRIIRSNVSGRFDNYDGSGNQARINWEVKFARGGVGAIVSSFVPVQLRGRIVPNYAMIDDDRHIPFWRAVGEAVHQYDCRFIVQLSHAGRQRDIAGIEYPTGLSSTDKADPTHGFRCERMTVEQIQETVQAFAEGARRTREAGLDGVELHGANGYLITQFLSSAINDRTDEYGGPLENRARFVLEVVRAIRQRVGRDFHLQMKISVQERNDAVAFFGIGPSGNTAEESVQVCRWLEEAGVDAFHISTGSFFPHPRNPAGTDLPIEELVANYDTLISGGDAAFRNYLLFRNFPSIARRQWNDAAPPPDRIEGFNLPDSRRVKASVGVPVICTGGFQTASVIQAAIQRGDCDAVSIARPLIANNDLVHIFSRGQDRAERPCTYCNKCLANVIEHPLGCYDETRYPSRDAMLAEVMSVFTPQPFPAGTEGPAGVPAFGVAAAAASAFDTSRAAALFANRPWYQRPRLFAITELIRLRNELRAKNLHDTEEPPFERADPPVSDRASRESRTFDGTNNDLRYPRMGAADCRFGRNVPIEHTYPDTANLLVPNPRVVSRELMTRHEFRPATILNLMAASWIQFMVHDWFVHRSSATETLEIPADAAWGEAHIRVARTERDPSPAGSTRPPAYVNPNSHWWDASQIYGCDAATAAALRTRIGGTLRIEPTGLLPVDPETGLHLAGFTDNWWIGLAMLHTLFTLEHNHLCDLLAARYPAWDDEQLYGKAKLINSALMAKIHTVEWTPAILPHPITKLALNVNWSGLLGDDKDDFLPFLNDSELLRGIVGSKADHHTAPYSLTEEFVSVYRMHPLMPDEIAFHSLTTGRLLETRELPEIAGNRTPAIAERITMADLFYSFGTSHPGAVTLNNYPRHLQNLTKDTGERLDLAAVDILRDRERGVPRYNQFRRLFHKPPVRSFDELTDDPTCRRQIKEVYNGDIEMVDLMTGLYAEPLPEGFGFSETAFRVFILMASRRLKSDRFFTDDYRPEIYTELGLDYLRRNTMRDVLVRHYPQLAPALQGVENAFAPWRRVGAA